jgi:hypothetical protein
LHRAPGSSLGGFLDRIAHQGDAWDPDDAIGTLQLAEDEPVPGDDLLAEPLRLMFGAGRRATEVAGDWSGFLTGWHDRARAWWGEGAGRVDTLLGLGICEQAGVFRGDGLAFHDWFDASRGPAQVVYVPDHAFIPSAVIVAEQCGRKPAQADEIMDDFARSFPAGPGAPSAADWMFAGSLMSALLRSPMTERRDVLTRGGLRQSGIPDAVVLSLNAESRTILRHRRLGYSMNCHGYRVHQAGPAFHRWLDREFEIVMRTPDDIRRDLVDLMDTVHARAKVAFLVLNIPSTTGHEDVRDYSPFAPPLGETLASVRAKDLNLILHDLARERDLAIVDNDAIAADMGSLHLPDGMHNSGPLQAELRAEILRILRGRGFAGFAAPALT